MEKSELGGKIGSSPSKYHQKYHPNTIKNTISIAHIIRKMIDTLVRAIARCPSFPFTLQPLREKLTLRHGTQTFMGPCAEIWGHRAWLLAENETQHVHYSFCETCVYLYLYLYLYSIAAIAQVKIEKYLTHWNSEANFFSIFLGMIMCMYLVSAWTHVALEKEKYRKILVHNGAQLIT